VAVCNFISSPQAAGLVAGRCEEAKTALAALENEARISRLCDSRALHGQLFAGLAPVEWPDAAGTWRGTAQSSIETAPRAVFLARRLPGLRYRDLCLSADGVATAMADLEARVRLLWQERPGRDDPWRDASFGALADLTARFFAIHPFMDGNGHLWRLVLPFLAERLGRGTRADWTVHKRPYGPEFSLALQWHGDHPDVLAAGLRRWFRPDNPAGGPEAED